MYSNKSFFDSVDPKKSYRFSVFVYDQNQLVSKCSFSCLGERVSSLILSALSVSYPSSFEIFVYNNSFRRFCFLNLPTSILVAHYF